MGGSASTSTLPASSTGPSPTELAPEFSEDGRGEYNLEEIPLIVSGLDAIDLKPGEIAAVLRTALQAEGGLLRQPDLRHSRSSQ
jgi:hypothetical protein